MTTPLLKHLAIFGLAAAAIPVAQAQVTIPVNSPGPINDAQTGDIPENTLFTFTVGNIGTITDLNFRLAISDNAIFGHNSARDFTVTLIAPNLTEVELFSLVGATTSPGAGTAIFDNTVFNQGSTSIAGDTTTVTFGAGPLGPEAASLNTFNGLNAAGTWTVRITDSSNQDPELVGFGAELGGNTALIITAVPEPTTFAMIFGLGALGFAAVRRFKKS